MAILVRKITRSKWPREKYNELTSNDLSADAITSCLRTTKNTLSTWEINDEEDLNEAILAMVSGFERLDTIDVVMMDKEKILEKNFTIDTSPGKTPVGDLVNSHRDLIELNYKSIGCFSELVLDSFENDKVKRIRKTTLKTILTEAISSGRVDISTLKPKISEELA